MCSIRHHRSCNCFSQHLRCCTLIYTILSTCTMCRCFHQDPRYMSVHTCTDSIVPLLKSSKSLIYSKLFRLLGTWHTLPEVEWSGNWGRNGRRKDSEVHNTCTSTGIMVCTVHAVQSVCRSQQSGRTRCQQVLLLSVIGYRLIPVIVWYWIYHGTDYSVVLDIPWYWL